MQSITDKLLFIRLLGGDNVAALTVSIIANVGGVKIPWEDLDEDQRRKIATKLNDDAMMAAGYKKCSGQKFEGRPEHIISA